MTNVESPPPTDLRQHLRVFLSADLVSATEFKVREPSEWPDRVRAVFTHFPADLLEAVGTRHHEAKLGAYPGPKIWKFNGDEILLYDYVYPDAFRGQAHLKSLVDAFASLVGRYDRELTSAGMGMRGTVWTAGFPLRNRVLRIRQGMSIPLVQSAEFEPVDDATGFVDHTANVVIDFVGPDLDLGFRIASNTPPGRVSCSLDVAWLLCQDPDANGIHHVGWRRLKGVANGAPYPMLWLMSADLPVERRPWDSSDPEAAPETRRFAADPTHCHLTARETRDLARNLWDVLKPHLVQPYPELPVGHSHAVAWRAGVDFPAEINIGDRPFAGQWTSRTSDVQTDVLNQIQMELQRDAELGARLRSVLLEIAHTPSYQDWLVRDQFDGIPYQLPYNLGFTRNRSTKWLLHRLALADYSELLVKINVADDKVFITDPLAVPGGYRVYPFDEESGRIRHVTVALGWDDWATCVIDPGTGCGHNLLRYPGSARRYGFDINTRALSFAAVNAAINEVEVSLLAASSVRDGLPPVFDQGRRENVLVLGNMPFSLPPRIGSLPVSAEGGRYGYELTNAALDAVADLRQRLLPESQLRCLQLFYSVGNRAADEWVVVQHARNLFGIANVRWHLVDAPLWRVNGVKRESNPMPLEKMQSRSKCKFYVRPPMTEDEVVRGYRELHDELSGKGWDHLVYGVLEINAPAQASPGRAS